MLLKIVFKHLELEMEITYDEKGYLDTVKNNNTGEYMMLESKMKGIGYKITEDAFMIGKKTNVCDARYVRIMDIDIFIPKFIFIPNILI